MEVARFDVTLITKLKGPTCSVLLAYAAAPCPPTLARLAELTGYTPEECLAALERAYALQLLPGGIILDASDPETQRLLAPHIVLGEVKRVPRPPMHPGGLHATVS